METLTVRLSDWLLVDQHAIAYLWSGFSEDLRNVQLYCASQCGSRDVLRKSISGAPCE